MRPQALWPGIPLFGRFPRFHWADAPCLEAALLSQAMNCGHLLVCLSKPGPWWHADEIFKAQMDYMQRISVFTLGNFVEMMSEIKAQSGVEGWSKMFRTKEQQDQLEQVMIDVKVGEQLLPQELRNPTLVGRRQRLRMASDAGVVRQASQSAAREDSLHNHSSWEPVRSWFR